MTNDFFNCETKLKLESFSNFDFDSIPSWSVLELICATNSIEVDLNLFLVLTVASRAFERLYWILLDAVKSGFVDTLANTDEFAFVFYRMYSPEVFGKIPEWEKFLKWYVNTHTINKTWFGYGYSPSQNLYVARAKYEMFAALWSRFPSLLYRFYAKRGAILNRKDRRFAEWLIRGMENMVAKGIKGYVELAHMARASLVEADRMETFLT